MFTSCPLAARSGAPRSWGRRPGPLSCLADGWLVGFCWPALCLAGGLVAGARWPVLCRVVGPLAALCPEPGVRLIRGPAAWPRAGRLRTGRPRPGRLLCRVPRLSALVGEAEQVGGVPAQVEHRGDPLQRAMGHAQDRYPPTACRLVD